MSDESDLMKGVRGWLNKQGYPLEMRVAEAFRTRGFSVARSTYFLHADDPPREIDAIAVGTIDDERFTSRPPGVEPSSIPVSERLVAGADIMALIECKSAPPTPAHPWIVFTQDFAESRSRTLFPMTDLAQRSILAIDAVNPAALFPMLREGSTRGVAVVEAALGGGKDTGKERKADGFNIAHAAVTKVATASRSMIKDVHELSGRLFRVIVPVVVTTCPLVECWLDNGAMRIEERGEMLVRSSRPRKAARPEITLVHVVREDRLPAFIDSVEATLRTVRENMDVVVATAPRPNATTLKSDRLATGRSPK